MKKIVALCSGGFDSVVMLHSIRNLNPDADIITLFFDYGQKSKELERNCFLKVSNKLNCTPLEVTLPTFSWTSSKFYSPEYSGADNEYLEMRNLIFISYALSVAESNKCSEVYLATLKSNGYFDTSKEFFDILNTLSSKKGIRICTPFSELSKYDLSPLVFAFNIKQDDFNSCDNPIENRPCGECPDCLAIKDIFSVVSEDSAFNVWYKNFDPYNEKFQKAFFNSHIDEMRVLTNNDCQIKCEHCYYGDNQMLYPRMTLEEFRKAFVEAKEFGINSFHFSGKEPLYDDFTFEVAKVLREEIPDAELTMVTNGISVSKYINELVNYGFSKIFLSVDDVANSSGIRHVSGVTEKALRALKDKNIDIEIFIDLHGNNYNKVPEIIDYLYTYWGLKKFYCRTSVVMGYAKNLVLLNHYQLNVAWEQIVDYANTHPDIEIDFSMACNYVYDILSDIAYTPLKDSLNNLIQFGNPKMTDNVKLFAEFFCTKYLNQITLTPDGFIHGCASEIGCKRYDLISPGNIKEHTLLELVKKGKELAIKCNKDQVNKDGSLRFYHCTCVDFEESNPIE